MKYSKDNSGLSGLVNGYHVWLRRERAQEVEPCCRQLFFFHKSHCNMQLWPRTAHLLKCSGWLSLPSSEGW